MEVSVSGACVAGRVCAENQLMVSNGHHLLYYRRVSQTRKSGAELKQARADNINMVTMILCA